MTFPLMLAPKVVVQERCVPGGYRLLDKDMVVWHKKAQGNGGTHVGVVSWPPVWAWLFQLGGKNGRGIHSCIVWTTHWLPSFWGWGSSLNRYRAAVTRCPAPLPLSTYKRQQNGVLVGIKWRSIHYDRHHCTILQVARQVKTTGYTQQQYPGPDSTH